MKMQSSTSLKATGDREFVSLSEIGGILPIMLIICVCERSFIGLDLNSSIMSLHTSLFE